MVAPGPFYLVGVLGVLAGFIVLRSWIRGLTGSRPQPAIVLGAALLAFVFGMGTIAVGIGFDSEQIRFDTRTFRYEVSVVANASDSVRLLFPAPWDSRVYAALNQTNGTSTLRLVRSSGTPFIEVRANGSVTFEVETTFIGLDFNRTLSAVTPPVPPSTATVVLAQMELNVLYGNLSSVDVAFQVTYEEYCLSTRYDGVLDIQAGTDVYPLVVSIVRRC